MASIPKQPETKLLPVKPEFEPNQTNKSTITQSEQNTEKTDLPTSKPEPKPSFFQRNRWWLILIMMAFLLGTALGIKATLWGVDMYVEGVESITGYDAKTEIAAQIQAFKEKWYYAILLGTWGLTAIAAFLGLIIIVGTLTVLFDKFKLWIFSLWNR